MTGGISIYENHLWKCKVSINGFRFLCNKKFLQNFLLHKKRSTMDTHSHEWKNVAKWACAGCVECRKRHSLFLNKKNIKKCLHYTKLTGILKITSGLQEEPKNKKQ